MQSCAFQGCQMAGVEYEVKAGYWGPESSGHRHTFAKYLMGSTSVDEGCSSTLERLTARGIQIPSPHTDIWRAASSSQ